MYLKAIILILILKESACLENSRPIIQDLLSSSKVIENESLFLSCQVKSGSNQPVQFKWDLNNREIKKDENIFIDNLSSISILNIKSMTLDLAGKFRCMVSNDYGSDSRTINLNLNGKSSDFFFFF